MNHRVRLLRFKSLELLTRLVASLYLSFLISSVEIPINTYHYHRVVVKIQFLDQFLAYSKLLINVNYHSHE